MLSTRALLTAVTETDRQKLPWRQSRLCLWLVCSPWGSLAPSPSLRSSPLQTSPPPGSPQAVPCLPAPLPPAVGSAFTAYVFNHLLEFSLLKDRGHDSSLAVDKRPLSLMSCRSARVCLYLPYSGVSGLTSSERSQPFFLHMLFLFPAFCRRDRTSSLKPPGLLLALLCFFRYLCL